MKIHIAYEHTHVGQIANCIMSMRIIIHALCQQYLAERTIRTKLSRQDGIAELQKLGLPIWELRCKATALCVQQISA